MEPTPIRLVMRVEHAYESYFLRGRVFRWDETTVDFETIEPKIYERPDVVALAGFTVSAYLGHGSLTMVGDESAGDVWGWGHFFAPDRVEDVEHAQRMAAVLRKVSKGLDRFDRDAGQVAGFAGYVARIASIIKAPIYTRTTARTEGMTGEQYRRVDASGLDYWVQDVAGLAERGEWRLINHGMSSTTRV